MLSGFATLTRRSSVRLLMSRKANSHSDHRKSLLIFQAASALSCGRSRLDPATGGPLRSSPASVTVVTGSCAEADAWATALMVQGPQAGSELAARLSLDALFLMREAGGIRTHAV